MTLLRLLVLLLLIGFHDRATSQTTTTTRYLAFQVFTNAPDPSVPLGVSGSNPLSPPPTKTEISRFVERLIARIGTTGTAETKLAVTLGPLSFDHTDDQLRRMIADAFEIALEHDIAVGFHLDDSMFWARRTDLWTNPVNVEWLDWEGTPNTGRRLDWGAEPTRIAPQMCLNSAAVQAEVRRLSALIGAAVSEGIATLAAHGRPDLFAGVISGWETQIGRDYQTNQQLGYCALTNRGYSRSNPPQDPDAELEQVVHAFIRLWASGLAAAGVEPIYSHTALVSRQTYATMTDDAPQSYTQVNQFAPPWVAFGEDFRPGFSTYPQPGLMAQIYEELAQRGSPAWASAEGANIRLNVLTSGGSMETYLAWMFNHGAALVNLFGWGVGSEAVENPFRTAAESEDALAAYRKFLNGEALSEGEYDHFDLAAKIQRIQAELPAWIAQNPARQGDAQALVESLDQRLRDGNYTEAMHIADAILRLIHDAG